MAKSQVEREDLLPKQAAALVGMFAFLDPKKYPCWPLTGPSVSDLHFLQQDPTV